MLSPSSMQAFSLLAFSGLIFFTWHLWRYDRFQCLIPTRQDWFRAMICHLMLVSVSLFLAFGVIQTFVLYDQYYANVRGVTMPVPWQLWPEKDQTLWRQSMYILAVGWACMQAVHLEEFLYWAYLISSIRYSSLSRQTWARSIYFKIWILAAVVGAGSLLAAMSVERQDLNLMRAYIFMTGGAISAVFAAASTAFCFAFPSFVRVIRAQGATYDVLDRLDFFAELNRIRVLLRWLYSIAFLMLSVDGLTPNKILNKSGFASDFIFIFAAISVFITACISIVLLLPRNMTSEAELTPSEVSEAQKHVKALGQALPQQHQGLSMARDPAPRLAATAPPASPAHLAILGQRLNVERKDMGIIAEEAVELPTVAYDAASSRGTILCSNQDNLGVGVGVGVGTLPKGDGDSLSTHENPYRAYGSQENIIGKYTGKAEAGSDDDDEAVLTADMSPGRKRAWSAHA